MTQAPPLFAPVGATLIGRGGLAQNPDQQTTIVARQTGLTAPGASAPGQHEGNQLG